MLNLKNYLSESYLELKERVTWPTIDELQKLTTIVLIGLAIITLLILAMDQLSKFSIIDLYYGNI